MVAGKIDFQAALLRKARWRPWEFALWLAAFALPLLVPSHALLVNEIVIVALFAMSLDLILGYTGIVSLGHAAFFGFGAYAAALFAKLVMPDPTVGLVVATALAALLGALASVTILRGSDLTRLMVTLGTALLLLELANKLDWLTGGADGLQGVVMGKVLGLFEFDLFGRTAAWYSLAVTLGLFLLMRRLVHSPLAQTTGFASLDVLAFDRSADVLLMLVIGGVGWLYGGIAGAIVFKLLQTWLSAVTPQYWMFWIGLLLVLLVLVGRDRLFKPWTWFGRRA